MRFLMPIVFLTMCAALGMILMCIFAFRLDSSDPRSNWIEQITNAIAQICIFAGLMFV